MSSSFGSTYSDADCTTRPCLCSGRYCKGKAYPNRKFQRKQSFSALKEAWAAGTLNFDSATLAARASANSGVTADVTTEAGAEAEASTETVSEASAETVPEATALRARLMSNQKVDVDKHVRVCVQCRGLFASLVGFERAHASNKGKKRNARKLSPAWSGRNEGAIQPLVHADGIEPPILDTEIGYASVLATLEDFRVARDHFEDFLAPRTTSKFERFPELSESEWIDVHCHVPVSELLASPVYAMFEEHIAVCEIKDNVNLD
ncbi:hypothetical protein JCM33374_g5330 [Metschnikowia sp. JCM 33374]|nr:hypothetical protein JCM33374_g5330 [Metschnikowia sp. JCM 33374]